jgi:tetratricopeptide (TPR) repeat protein
MVLRVDQIGLTACIGRLRRLSAFKMLKTESNSSGCSPTLDETLSRCISIPLATAWAYKERPCLSKELHENLRRVQDDFELARAVAVTGPEGTGKTQLVLRFVEENEQDYDVVLWIDVQSEEAVRSSFERCCHALCLPFDSSATHASLQGMPCVQAVLSLLRDQAAMKSWLVVFDNADDLPWDLDALVPKGHNGTVVIISRNAEIQQLFNRDTALVLGGVDRLIPRDSPCRQLIEDVANCLHRNALASDLAAARIEVDIEDGEDLAAALQRYLLDYRYFHKRLLLDRDFADAGEHTKAVRTACAVSLASLRELYDGSSNSFPIELLTFMTFLDRGGIQDELCRLGSLSLDQACNRLQAEASEWMQRLFGRGKDGDWDDTAYRATTRVLWRYRLVMPVGEPWRGSTMHSAVRRQVSKSMVSPDHWYLYVVFMASACAQSEKEANSAHFRRHLILHLPSNNELPGLDAVLDVRGLRWLWSTIARVLSEAHKWIAAEELVTWEIMASSRLSGENHLDTIVAMANLATLYWSQGRWDEAELLDIEVLSASLKVLGEDHPDTITAMDSLAATYKGLGRPQEAKALLLKVLKYNIKELGVEHCNTKTAMSNLAAAYCHLR